MAAPVDSARQGTNITSASTSHAINVGSPAADTLLIVLVRFAGAPGTVTFTGYSSLVSDTSDASDDTTQIFYRWADGTEGATDTLSTGNSVKLAAICWEITGASDPAQGVPTRSTVAVGTTAANGADPDSAVPLVAPQDTLYLALMGIDGEGNAPTVAPANYSNLATANSGTGGSAATNCSVGGASRQLSASSSEDPGNFTHAGANAGWTAFTVAIRPPNNFATDAARAVFETTDANTTTPAFTTPSGIVAGQLLVLFWRSGGGSAGTIIDAAGFTELINSNNIYVGYKVADGTEGSSITQTVTNGRRFVSIMWRIANGATPTASTVATASGTTSVDPATYNPGVGEKNFIWLALGSTEDSRTVSAFPSPYVNTAEANVSSGLNGATVMGASRQVASTQVNPNPFTVNTNSNNITAVTVAIDYEADAVTSTFVPKVILL